MDLSIIIPMYNASDFLDRLLDSIYNQDSHGVKFEVIMIDDASKDKSVEKVKDYVRTNNLKNLRMITQTINGGTASSRNKGLENATGKWIQFVDSDDWIQDNYFEVLSKKISNTEVDCYIYGVKKYWEDSITINTPVGNIDKRMIGYKNIVVNKLYKKDYILNFDPQYKFEDVIWLVTLMSRDEYNCEILEDLYYHVNRTNEYSKMANFDSEEWYKMASTIVSNSRQYDKLTRAFVLETFVGTFFAKSIKLKYRLAILIRNVYINIKLLVQVTTNGIRNLDKYEKKESHH